MEETEVQILKCKVRLMTFLGYSAMVLLALDELLSYGEIDIDTHLEMTAMVKDIQRRVTGE